MKGTKCPPTEGMSVPVLSELPGFRGRQVPDNGWYSCCECGQLEPDMDGGFITTIWTLWRLQYYGKIFIDRKSR